LVFFVYLVWHQTDQRDGGDNETDQNAASRVSEALVSNIQQFVMEGEEGYLGGKTAEPSISSSEATGSNKSIVIFLTPNSRHLPMHLCRELAGLGLLFLVVVPPIISVEPT
jgi:hypothetical protein